MTELTSISEGRFGVILADPPWAFKTYGGKSTAPTRKSVGPYDVMGLEDIKALPVVDVAAPDCLLFMWTVSHLQAEAFDVAAAWGFRPVSVAFIWDKGQIGMGYWTRQEAEICHLFKRGKPHRLSKGVRQIIRSPRREHSRKPDEQFARIEALAVGPYLEMFARQSRPGWHVWGDQVEKFDPVSDAARRRAALLADAGPLFANDNAAAPQIAVPAPCATIDVVAFADSSPRTRSTPEQIAERRAIRFGKRFNAQRSAIRAIGPHAAEGVHFITTKAGDDWSWSPVESRHAA